MDDLCQKHKDAGRCDRPGIAKQCARVCEGDNGGDKNPPAAPPASEEDKTVSAAFQGQT